MPLMSEAATLSKLTNELKHAPHVVAIYNAVVARQQHAEDEHDVYLLKKQRQAERVTEAQRAVNFAKRNVGLAEYADNAATADADLKTAEAALAIEQKKLADIKPSRGFHDPEPSKLAALIQSLRYGHRTRSDAPKVNEPSLEGIARANEDRLKLEAELQEVQKAPCDKDEAVRRALATFDRACKSVKGKLPFTGFYCNETDVMGRVRPAQIEMPKLIGPNGERVPDAYALLLITLAPVIRESIVKQVKDAGARFEFDNPLTTADRKKKVDALQKKIAACVALECAHIRGLALAGQCPPIRRNIPLDQLFALEPISEAKAEFETEQATEPGNTVASRGGATVLREASGFAGPGRARAAS